MSAPSNRVQFIQHTAQSKGHTMTTEAQRLGEQIKAAHMASHQYGYFQAVSDRLHDDVDQLVALAAQAQEPARHPKRSVEEWKEITALEDQAGGVFAGGAIASQPAAPAQGEPNSYIFTKVGLIRAQEGKGDWMRAGDVRRLLAAPASAPIETAARAQEGALWVAAAEAGQRLAKDGGDGTEFCKSIDRLADALLEAPASVAQRDAYTGEQIYAAWLAMGIDMRCLDWAEFAEKLDGARDAAMSLAAKEQKA